MTKRLSKYTVYVMEEFIDRDNEDLIDALIELPGYVDHEWDEWVPV